MRDQVANIINALPIITLDFVSEFLGEPIGWWSPPFDVKPKPVPFDPTDFY